MTTAVFGGSFNPPHVGHALVAGWLLWTGRADAVWLVPTHVHPFGKSLAPFERRLAMCRALAGSVSAQVGVSDIEASLRTPSYTLDTLRALQIRHPDRRFRLVLGADAVPDLPRWHRWDAIERDFAPILVGRQGWPTPEGAIDFPGVSSTDIRSRLASGVPVDHLVPAEVLTLLGDLYSRSGPKPSQP